MSWKSFITAGLLCVLASPAFAVGPNMGLVAGGTNANGHLDSNDNWVWTVQVTPDLTQMPSGDTSGTPVAVELGFSSSTAGETGNANPQQSGQGNVLGAARNAGEAVNFDTLNPGSIVFSSWQNTTNGLLDANSNNKPTGIQLNAPGVGTNAGASYTTNSSVSGTANQVFAALGSKTFTTAGAENMLNITVQKPAVNLNNTVTKTTIQVSGAYGGNGRIAQINGGTSGGPYTIGTTDSFGGAGYSFTMQARGGDTELNGTNDFTDIQNLLPAYLQGPGKNWEQGDFDGSGSVDFTDIQILLTNYLKPNYVVGPPATPALGAGGGLSGVPESATLSLMALALLGGLGVIRRKR